jgi:hypothetical protein
MDIPKSTSVKRHELKRLDTEVQPNALELKHIAQRNNQKIVYAIVIIVAVMGFGYLLYLMITAHAPFSDYIVPFSVAGIIVGYLFLATYIMQGRYNKTSAFLSMFARANDFDFTPNALNVSTKEAGLYNIVPRMSLSDVTRGVYAGRAFMAAMVHYRPRAVRHEQDMFLLRISLDREKPHVLLLGKYGSVFTGLTGRGAHARLPVNSPGSPNKEVYKLQLQDNSMRALYTLYTSASDAEAVQAQLSPKVCTLLTTLRGDIDIQIRGKDLFMYVSEFNRSKNKVADALQFGDALAEAMENRVNPYEAFVPDLGYRHFRGNIALWFWILMPAFIALLAWWNFRSI